MSFAPMKPNLSLKILIVEDHQQTADVMARLIRARDLPVVTAGSLAEARTCVREHAIGFLISDLGLPDGDGCELMAELREEFGLQGAVVSGYGMKPDLARTRAAGFILHLVKPIQMSDLERLLALARKALDLPPPALPGIH